MPSKIYRKVLQSGSSKCAALPPDWLRIFNLDAGATVEMVYDSVIIIKPTDLKLDIEFLKKELELIMKLEGQTEQQEIPA